MDTDIQRTYSRISPHQYTVNKDGEFVEIFEARKDKQFCFTLSYTDSQVCKGVIGVYAYMKMLRACMYVCMCVNVTK